MDKKVVRFEDRQFEQRLSEIGAKIADAVDFAHQAKELADRSETILVQAQKEVEELYLSFGERKK